MELLSGGGALLPWHHVCQLDWSNVTYLSTSNRTLSQWAVRTGYVLWVAFPPFFLFSVASIHPEILMKALHGPPLRLFSLSPLYPILPVIWAPCQTRPLHMQFPSPV